MLALHGLPSWQPVLLAALQASRQAVCCVLGVHIGSLHVACDAVHRLEVTPSGVGAGTLQVLYGQCLMTRSVEESGPDS